MLSESMTQVQPEAPKLWSFQELIHMHTPVSLAHRLLRVKHLFASAKYRKAMCGNGRSDGCLTTNVQSGLRLGPASKCLSSRVYNHPLPSMSTYFLSRPFLVCHHEVKFRWYIYNSHMYVPALNPDSSAVSLNSLLA